MIVAAVVVTGVPRRAQRRRGAAALAAPGLQALLGRDSRDHQRRDRIEPPPAEQRVPRKADRYRFSGARRSGSRSAITLLMRWRVTAADDGRERSLGVLLLDERGCGMGADRVPRGASRSS
jgi:hypothetical protein